MANSNQNLTLGEVHLAQWWRSKSSLFKKIILSIVIAINVVVWTIFIYQLVIYIIYSPNYRETIRGLATDLVDYDAYHRLMQPNAPIVKNVYIINRGINVQNPQQKDYDLIAEVENDNTQWTISSLVGQFDLAGQPVVVNGFLMPKQKKYFLALRQQSTQSIGTTTFEMKNIVWRRIKPAERDRLNIVNDLSFERANFSPASVLNNKQMPAQVEFTAINHSAYSFWQVNTQVVLYQGAGVVDAYIFPIDNWMAGQTRTIIFNLIHNVNFINQIVVTPDINWFDNSIFIKP
jgi:hypothetical protein